MHKLTWLVCFCVWTPLLAQSTCPGVDFQSARWVDLKPSATSHTNVVRQIDGTYTAYELSDAPPYRVISQTPHFELQLGACLPHALASVPKGVPVLQNPPGAGSQSQVAAILPSGNYFVASISGLQIVLDTFSPRFELLSEDVRSTSNGSELFTGLLLADVNGDGNADLVAVAYTTTGHGMAFPAMWVFPGNGDGTFLPGARQDLGGEVYQGPVTFAIGDLNNDGKLDLVIYFPAYVVVALQGSGGTFAASLLTITAPAPFSVGLSTGAVALADLNRDGKLDLVLANSGVQVALGNGDGTFQAVKLFSTLPELGTPPGGSGGAVVAIGDVNGDGLPDIVGGGSILFGDGKGGFPSRRDYAVDSSGAVMLADFDGDGQVDIIIGTGTPALLLGNSSHPALTVLFGQGGGVFTAAPVSQVDSSAFIAAADFDGDGFPDVASVSLDNTILNGYFLSILKGNGEGDFSSVFQYVLNAGPIALAVADFNGDGKPDAAVLIESGAGRVNAVQLFLGIGDGTLAAPSLVSIPAASPTSLAAVDLNGDGIPDLAVIAQGGVFTWLGRGDGTFSSPTLIPVAGGFFAFGDFNGDGKLDVAVTTVSPSSLTVLLGKGDCSFSSPGISTLLSAVSPQYGLLGPLIVAAADFNGDGRLDLVTTFSNTGGAIGGEIAILLGRGDGTFQSPVLLAEPAITVATADLNGDGIPDLILPLNSGTSFATVVLLGNGDGTFQPAAAVTSAVLPALLAVDFNRDGRPDIVGTLSTFGLAAFENLSHPSPALSVVSAASFAPGPLAPHSIASAFGKNLATGTAAAGSTGAGLVSTFNLAGTTVTVQDASGVSRPAQLFFVSPGQVNFLVPAATATGAATITITSGAGNLVHAQINISALTPALFSEGASGIAAAYLVQVASASQTIEPVFWAGAGGIVAVPIDLAVPGQVYLVLFGTGFDAAAANSVVANVQGVNAPVYYAGPQPTWPGLDQVNVLLPTSLAGTGVASVVLSVAGSPANTVYVTVQ